MRLRILAWNINHRSQHLKKGPPETIPSRLLSFSPDIIVLTKYVEAAGPSEVQATEKRMGFVHGHAPSVFDPTIFRLFPLSDGLAMLVDDAHFVELGVHVRDDRVRFALLVSKL